MSDTDGKKFPFTCPECFVTLKARVGQSGTRLMCPSCGASIVVPDAPAAKSIAGQTERTIDTSAAEAAGGYDIHTTPQSASEDSGHSTPTPTRRASEDSASPTSTPPRSPVGDPGYSVRDSKPPKPNAPDLIAVKCHICQSRTHTERKNLGKKIRCSECGTVLPIAEAAKSPAQMRKPHKIDEAGVGEYGVGSPRQSAAARQEISIPFHCRLCETLLRGSLAEVGAKLTCPDCGTKTVVPPPKKVEAKAVVGAAAEADLDDYGVQAPNIAAGSDIPVVCSLCSSRLMARADQVGQKIKCPDCGEKTVVSAPTGDKAGAFMGVMADGKSPTDYAVNTPKTPSPAAEAAPTELLLGCSMCGRKIMASTSLAGRDVACPDCGTLIPVPKPKVPSPAAPSPGSATPASAPAPAPQKVKKEKVVHIGVNCPRCGTRIHATDRQVGKKVPCPDCNSPITIPPPKADAQVEERVIGGGGEYGVSAPQEVLSQTVKSGRALPTDDPDFDFLDEVDDPELRWRLRDRSDELGFLGHPGASKCWFEFSLGGAAVFAIPAFSLMMFGMPESGAVTAVIWFVAFISLALAILVCLAWAALFSVNLLAIVQDTSAENHIIRNWPKGPWSEQIGESLYVFSSCLVSFIPVSILLQSYPPARPVAIYLYMTGFWLTLPVVLLSMLETGSALSPVSGHVASSLLRRPGAWAWFYLRSFGLLAVGLAMYIAFWRHICGLFGLGPFAMPLLVPMATALAMVYARWLGILGVSVREVIEEASHADEDEED